jgi:hypothetical protein
MACKWKVHSNQQSLHIASHRSHTFPHDQTCSPTNTTIPDYVQALQDESRIRAEKIGSGNWYWSFISDDKLALQRGLEIAQTAYEKALATDNELKAKIAEGEAQRKEDEEMLDGSGESREQLLGSKRLLEGEIEGLRRELATYSDNDPVELERKGREAADWKVDVGVCTDDVYSMEGWLKDLTGGGEALMGLLKEMYGSEWDDEVGGLKELAWWVEEAGSMSWRACSEEFRGAAMMSWRSCLQEPIGSPPYWHDVAVTHWCIIYRTPERS